MTRQKRDVVCNKDLLVEVISSLTNNPRYYLHSRDLANLDTSPKSSNHILFCKFYTFMQIMFTPIRPAIIG